MAASKLTVEINAVFANKRAFRALARAHELASELADGSEWNQDLVKLKKLIRIAAKGIRFDTSKGERQ